MMAEEKHEETQETEKPFCCRCKEDFPVAKELTTWRMGQMRLLSKLPKGIRDRNHLQEWVNSELHGPGYLCGNCYFDLTGG